MTQQKIKSPYPDMIINAFKSVQAWRTLSIVLMSVVTLQAGGLIWLANQRSVLLIPQNLSSLGAGGTTITLGAPFTPAYLTEVAHGDLYALLNWTPDNIEGQYGHFLSRLSSSLYDAQREVLIKESKKHLKEGVTQSFHPIRTYVKGSEVTVHGTLIRAEGGREVFRGPAVYAINYTHAGNGLVLIAGVSQPQNSRDADTE